MENLQIKEIVSRFNLVKDYLTIRLVNQTNTPKLGMIKDQEIPFEEFLDLAIIATVSFDDCSVKVNNGLLTAWGKTFDEVLQIAKENFYTGEMRLAPLPAILNELIETSGTEEEKVPEDSMDFTYVLTNKEGIFAAGLITSETIMNGICEKLESNDLIVIPSSVHECLIMPDVKGINITDITKMVVEVNVTQVELEEVLSDHAYIYRQGIGWEV